VAYSAVSDLLTGNIPVSGPVDPDKYVSDAADEIDSKIGHIYETPIDVTEGGPLSRPARLLLKRISNWLASGRLLMAAAAGSQKMELNAYANKLVSDATFALDQIASGDIILEGAPRRDGSEEPSSTGPQIHNLDPESNVEAFYNRIANPNYRYLGLGYPVLGGEHGGLVR